MHCHFRDCQEWRSEGLPLASCSNEAVKLFDAALTQYVGFYDDDAFGGLVGTFDKLSEADPNFIMGQVLINNLELIGAGRSPRLDSKLRKSLETLVETANNDKTLSDRERRHVTATKLLGDGFMKEACDVWESILVCHPTDMFALKLAHDCYFYLGYKSQVRDSVARVLPSWKSTTPLYGYLIGMYSFGLCETGRYDDAHKTALMGLELNRSDAWSAHTVAHVYEMQGQQDEGLTFLNSTLIDWQSSNLLSCHLHWHWALYHVENGDYQEALNKYDQQIGLMATKSGAMLDIVDACSILYRLEMEGVGVGDRWRDLYETCVSHVDDHLLAFNDVHFLMTFIGARQRHTVDAFLDSIRKFIRSCKGTNRDVSERVGVSLCEALVAVDDGDFAKAVDLVHPIKYDVLSIGGSDAQRDLFSQFLIHAAIKSPKPEHNKLARRLLAERKALRPNSSLTDRLMVKVLSSHIE